MLARNLREGPKWLLGTILKRTGPVSYRVQVGDQVWRRRTDQLLSSQVTPTDDTAGESQTTISTESRNPVSLPATPHAATEQSSTEPQGNPSATPTVTSTETESNTTSPPRERYPTRQRHPPDRLSHETHAK